MRVGGIVAAGGRGERLGGDVPKALCPVHGVSLLVRAVQALLTGGVTDVVVAAPAAHLGHVRSLLAPMSDNACAVEGGATRQESVRRGLAALSPPVEIVLVHDAARALAPASLVRSVVGAVAQGADAVVPVVPLSDTVKELDPDGVVLRTVDRSTLWAVQTPQGFRRSVLAAAHDAAASGDATDDAALVEAMGVKVVTVAGAEEAFKVTRPLDVARAEAVLSRLDDE